MSNFKLSLDYQAIGNLLKSDDVKQLVEEKAKKIASRCGEGYIGCSLSTSGRHIAIVSTTDEESEDDCRNNDTIMRCIYD